MSVGFELRVLGLGLRFFGVPNWELSTRVTTGDPTTLTERATTGRQGV